MLEIIFSAVIICVPLLAVVFRNFMPVFLFAVIGSNPYVTAGSLVLALAVRFRVINRHSTNLPLLILCLIWLGYGIIIGLLNYSVALISEYIQLIIAISFVIYIYNSLNSDMQLRKLLKSFILSGFVLSLFEIGIFVFDQDINTSSFIGRISENYTSFYLVISTIVIPFFFIKIIG